MCNCGKVNSIPKVYTAPPINQVFENCLKSRADIQILYDRVNCVKKTTVSKLTNKFLGVLLTMLNLKEYCKYDIAEIELFVADKNC